MSEDFNMARFILQDKENNVAVLSEENNEIKELTYKELDDKSNKVANFLKDIGIKKGKVISVFLNKSMELFPIVLGILKIGAVYSPLFSSFGSLSLAERIKDSKPSLIVTGNEQLNKLINLDKKYLPEDILVLKENKKKSDMINNYIDYYNCIDGYSYDFFNKTTSEDDISAIYYTSGTTSTAKGVVHTHKNIKRYLKSFEEVFNPKKEDVYWCTADHAWITGSVYGIFAPLAKGLTNIINGNNLSAKKIYNFLEDKKINIWYTAPTFLRILMRQKELTNELHYNFNNLNSIYSVGEPLTKGIIDNAYDIFGLTIKNTWFQTETASIILANTKAINGKETALGKPLTDVNVGIMDDNFNLVPSGEIGKLVIKSGWRSMFVNYLNKQKNYNNSFKNGWYITGDLAKKDNDGYYWFISREDDIINVAGHLVNPIEIENVLKKNKIIDNVIATSIKDSTMGQRVKLVIVLNENNDDDFQTKLKIKKIIRKKLSHYEVPKQIDFVESIETTKSGKIIRS